MAGELTLSVLGGSLDVREIAVAGLGVHRLGKRRAIVAGERLLLQLRRESRRSRDGCDRT